MSSFLGMGFSIDVSIDGDSYETLGDLPKPELTNGIGAPSIKVKVPMKSKSKQPRIVWVTKMARVVSMSRGLL